MLTCGCVSMKCIDASMTVNSKEAFKVVMGMFNQPSSDEIHIHDNFQLDVNFEKQFAFDAGQFKSD